MKKVSLDVWIQLLGMLGVLAGLIFVGLELQQSQRIAVAAQQQDRAAITNDIINAFYEVDVDFQYTYFERDFFYELSTEEIAYRNAIHKAWFLYENDFYQYEQGLMNESTWRAKLNGIQQIYNYCDVRNLYNSRAQIFSVEFRNIVDSLPDNCSN